MKFEINTTPIPFLIVYDTFNELELEHIYQEINFLFPKLRTEDTGGAVEKDGSSSKKNSGLFLDECYSQPNQISDILSFRNNFLNRQVILDSLIKCSPIYRCIREANLVTSLLSYYKDGDYYNPHYDVSRVTWVTWFFKEPKCFSGGEFEFSDANISIEPKNNMSVIFLSGLHHRVTPVNLTNQNEKMGGRFTLTTFIDFVPFNKLKLNLFKNNDN